MANRYAVQSGVWSEPATWDGGSLPGPGDVVRPSGKTVTIDVDIEVDLLTSTVLSPALAGGQFVAAEGVSIIADVTGGQSSGDVLVVAVPGVSVHGDVTGGSASSQRALLVSAGGDVELHGSVTGGSSGNAHGVNMSGGSVTITGPVTGGHGNSAFGVNMSGGSVTITGSVSGGTVSNAYGVSVTGGSVTITGPVTGSTSYGVNVAGSAVVDVDGPITADAAPAIGGTTNGLVRVTGPLHHSPDNISPIAANRWVIHAQPANTVWYMRDDSRAPSGGDEIALTVWNEHTPPPGDTRAGHVYGHGGLLTGTLAVPPPQSVAAGVPTDDTTGTAALAPSDVWDNQPNRLRNVATVATTGAQLEAALDTGDTP